MTEYLDLVPLPYFGEELSPYLRAVGWLGPLNAFSTGTVPEQFVERLTAHRAKPFGLVECMGFHRCEFCPSQGAMGQRNLWIPGRGFLYVATELIVHYVDAHGYAPPLEFQRAVESCAEPGTPALEQAIMANGGEDVERAIEDYIERSGQ